MLEDDTWEVVVGKLVNSSTCQSPANNTKGKTTHNLRKAAALGS